VFSLTLIMAFHRFALNNVTMHHLNPLQWIKW